MAGHSHWAGIKHKKGRQDKVRSKLFSKLSREINEMKNKTFTANFEVNGVTTPKKITGVEVMEKIQTFWSKKMKETYDTWLKGNKEHIDRYFFKDENGIEQARVEDFVKDVKEVMIAGKNPHKYIQIGNDHMRKMANHVMIRNTKNPALKRALAKRFQYMETL